MGDRCDNAHVHYLGLKPFGCEAGDKVAYKLSADGIDNPVVAVRYKTVTDGDAKFALNGTEIILPHSDALTIVELPFAEDFELVSLGGAGVELDFVAVYEKATALKLLKSSTILNLKFQQRKTKTATPLILIIIMTIANSG